ncbi:hypothetical protein DID80_00700 [Candidatus Marinamargulisbacteria bacterium SCGC AAA071-K20]|nr:hypothetical protein DID80_00700 [Candidatus Marinamargulisbacteria bacterium SCGC AAA071-K20]
MAKKKKINLKRNIDDLDLESKKSLRAIAVKYDVEKGTAPKIIATGKGRIAEKILEVAEEHRIPFYEDQTLSDLLEKLEIDDEIPPELYTLVAEVLAFVYQLDKLAKKRQLVKKRQKKN